MIQYYILDLETTGLSQDIHEITQISIIRCIDKAQLNKYIKPDHPERTHKQALAATGRTWSDLYKGTDKKTAVDFVDLFFSEDGLTPEERCIIGHNIYKFDRKFLISLWSSLGKEFPANLWLDTLVFARSYAKMNNLNPPNFKLDSVLEMFGVKFVGQQHNAVSDTRNNYRLYEYLIKTNTPVLPHIKRFAHSENNV
jgi:DNA polymerase III epsilon subunit-like protein